MADLTVETDPIPGTPAYCAKRQRDAADAIAKAKIRMDGAPTTVGGHHTYSKVWDTHGLYWKDSNDALDAATNTRNDACDQLAAASLRLAELCDKAAEAYKNTDDMLAESINKQLVPEITKAEY